MMLGFAALLLLANPGLGQRVEAVEPNRGGDLDLSTRDPARALEHLHPAPGYVVELFASEQDFPIGNPVSLTFDARGRLWLATMPSYPQRLPDQEPNDKLIILEDTDNDGRADRQKVLFGHASSESIEVVSGLAPGSQIILSDSSNWIDNPRIYLN